MSDTDEGEELGHLWAVHSTKDERPVLRAWAASEEEAQKKAEQFKRSDPVPDDEYWTTRLTKRQINALKGNGFIPPNA
ncbi:MAG: hypothetical protein JXR83_22975 [Deltaproteobacteria bacterium]|nr:hypothetical protein [Deltaproteobacteria bacterium]